jgi:hypothetical protein
MVTVRSSRKFMVDWHASMQVPCITHDRRLLVRIASVLKALGNQIITVHLHAGAGCQVGINIHTGLDYRVGFGVLGLWYMRWNVTSAQTLFEA